MVTTVTILLATIFWTVAIASGWAERKWATWLWTIGFGLFVIHILAAFQEYYQWNHSVAIAETARQTKELTGWDSGFGLYINYAFAVCLAIDLVSQYRSGLHHKGRKFIDAFVIFMIINGAIVFGTFNSRIVGCACLLALIIARIKTHSPSRSSMGF